MHTVVIYSLLCLLFLSFYEVDANSASTNAAAKHRCGVSRVPPKRISQRIIGGDEATPHSWPWVVALMAQIRNRTFGYFCSGTIIAPRLVVTAAHCIAHSIIRNNLVVLVGTHNISNTKPSPRIFLPDNFTIPELYRAGNVLYRNDIALIHLSRNIKFNRYVQPVCLPRKDEDIADGTIMYSVGWGITGMTSDHKRPSDVLRQVAIPVISNEQCRQSPQKDTYGNVTDLELCAGITDPPQGTCSGDSGSPLVAPGRNGGWTMYGITSAGADVYDPVTGKKLTEVCINKGGPEIYVRVSKYVDWIHEHMNRTASATP